MAIETHEHGEEGKPDDDRSIDARWRELTTAANEALARGDGAQARASYEAALVEAEGLLQAERIRGAASNATSPHATRLAPMLFVIASQNLAELDRRERHFDRASALLLDAFDRIVAIAETLDAPLPLRAACVRNFAPALAEIVEDLTARGRSGDLPPLLDRANAAHRAVALAMTDTPTS